MNHDEHGCTLLSNAPLPLHYRRNVLLKFVGASLALLGAMWLFSGCAFLAGADLTAASVRDTHLMTGPVTHSYPVPPPMTEDQMLKELQRPR